MSVQALTWVIDYERTTGLGTRLVLLSIANHADPRGEYAFASVETMAREANMSRSQAFRCLAFLRETGVVEVMGTHSRGMRIYRIPGVRGGSHFRDGGGRKSGTRTVLERSNKVGSQIATPSLPPPLTAEQAAANAEEARKLRARLADSKGKAA